MIEVKITETEMANVAERLRVLKLNTPKVLDRILKRTMARYQRYLVSWYVSGQMISRLSGRTARLLYVRKLRRHAHDFYVSGWPLANIYEHGSTKRQGLFRPYMTRSMQSFAWWPVFSTEAEGVIVDELRRQGLDG
jgi:hypothetical protein